MNKKKIARWVLYIFLMMNIIALWYFSYTDNETFSIEFIEKLLTGENLVFALVVYIFIMVLRGLTLFPWTPLVLLWAIIFPLPYALIALMISVQCYIYLIHKYSAILDFSVPSKILEYKPKIEKHWIKYIALLCLIPWMSMNILAYFLSILQVSLRDKMIWIWIWSFVSIVIYLYLFREIFNYFT